MEIINQMLAKLFDSFKAKNPKIATIIIFVLGVVIYSSENGLSDLIGYDMSKVVEYTAIVLGFLTGSRTTSFISTDSKK